jgi:oxygen-independent coproporphyrinogen-3 oxidase
MVDYTEALCREIEDKVKQNISTIFIGGGTPTYLSLDYFKLLKQTLDKVTKDKEIEFTVECNPESLSAEKLEFFKEMGINRLSIGLQAWQDRLLRTLGRVHSVEKFIHVFNMAREKGFTNINIDLMFGLPGQSLSDWEETLMEVVNLDPEHISCYSLIVEEHTPFYRLDESGRLILPEEEEERRMYELAVKYLKKQGYHQYEISNFSKNNCACRHNLTYWNLHDYIGCGSGAASFINGVRYKNVEDIEKYMEGIMQSKPNYCERIVNSVEDSMEEFMFMGLRKTEGISKKDFNKRFNKNVNEVYGKTIEKFVNKGLLAVDEDRIFLTAKGVELSNQVMCEFIM